MNKNTSNLLVTMSLLLVMALCQGCSSVGTILKGMGNGAVQQSRQHTMQCSGYQNGRYVEMECQK